MSGQPYRQPQEAMDATEQVILDLVRLGLQGDGASIRQLGRKLLRHRSPETHTATFQERLGGLLVGVDASPLRGGRTPIPLEPDSKLPLAFVEDPALGDPPILDAGADEVLRRLLAERRAIAQLSAAGLDPPRTVLLSGPPGVGKTMTARYIAAELRLPLIGVELATLMSSLLGKTGQNLRQLLDHARAAPCVLLLDEFDAVAKRRDDQTDIGELKRLVNVLLVELDRWPASGLLVAATNHPQLLDPAVDRRFDIRLELALPAFAERVAILRRAATRTNMDASPTVLAACALALDGSSGADLEQIVTQAARRAVLGETFDRVVAEHALGPLRMNPGAGRRAAFCALAAEQGLSHREIATMLGVSHPTVGKLIKLWRTEYEPAVSTDEHGVGSAA